MEQALANIDPSRIENVAAAAAALDPRRPDEA